jgi:MFS family permease
VARQTSVPVSLDGRMLAVLLAAVFMGQFDFFAVNVAAPSLQRTLGAGAGALQLIVAGYAFAYAAGLITGGRLGDILGHRRIFWTGMLAFAAASLLCGLAASPVELVLARLGQGLAAAMMLPQVLALITAGSSPSERPRAFAWYGVAAGAGSVAGQILGGVLLTDDVGGLQWRLIFLVNVPIGVVAALLAVGWLPNPAPSGGGPLDPVGALGVAVTIGLVLVPLALGQAVGWPWWTWVMMCAAAPCLWATMAWQHRLRERGGSPTLDLGLLRNPSLRRGLFANAAFLLYFASFMFVLTLVLQDALGLSPLRAGLAFAPAGVAYSLSALAARHLVARYGLRVLVTGCVISAVALVALLIRLRLTGADTEVSWVVCCAAAMSLGNGLVLPSLIGAALTGVEASHAGAAAGMVNTAQQFASSTGVALVGTVYFAVADMVPGVEGRATAACWAGMIDLVLIIAVAGSLRLLATRNGAAAQAHDSATERRGRTS